MTLDMRTIKFRGKRISDGEWVYGYLNEAVSPIKIGNTISKLRIGRQFVAPDTIGQFTGLYDKNGKEIYEGDIVAEGAFKRVISFIPEAAAFCSCYPYESSIRTRTSADEMRFYEVIGNIHDNEQLV